MITSRGGCVVDRDDSWPERRVIGLLDLIGSRWQGPRCGPFGAGMTPAFLTPMTSRAAPPSVADGPTAASRIRDLLLPALLGPAQVFLIGPLSIFQGNREEMGLGIEPMLPMLVGSTIVAWLILVVIGRLLPYRLDRPYRVLLTAVGVVLWLLGSLVVGDYGVFDGRHIDFETQAGRTPYELLAWLGIPIVALLFHRRLATVCGVLAGALLATQLVGLIFGGIFGGVSHKSAALEPPAAIFELSRQQNALILVLDAFQSEAFLEQLGGADNERLVNAFTGFTFFPEHTSAFPNTRPSIPAMLSGRRYGNDTPIEAFYDDTLRNRSLITAFDQAGWQVDMVSMVARMIRGPLTHGYRLPRPFASTADVRFHEAARLLDVSLFRHAPHGLKPWVYNHQEWRVMSLSKLSRNVHQSSNGKDFLSRFTSSLEVTRDTPVAKIVHVGIPHLPAVLDAECKWRGVQSPIREHYVDQTRCAVRLVEDLIARLKTLGVYDDMLFVIAADHGTFFAPPSFEGFVPQPAAMTWLVGRAMPLLLVKPPGASGPLETSAAPTAISDVAATVGDAVGLDFDFEGTPVFELEPDLDAGTQRDRRYDAYFWEDVGPKDTYFPFVHRFAIRGPVRHAESWHYLGTAYPPGTSLAVDRIDVGTHRSREYLGLGWSRARRADGEDRRWALGARATLQASLPPESLTVRLRMRVPAFIDNQRIELAVDGTVIGSWQPTDDGFAEYRATLEAAPRPAISSIELRFDRFTTYGDDPRPLAAQVAWIAFDKDE